MQLMLVADRLFCLLFFCLVSTHSVCPSYLRNRMALLPTQAFYLLINNKGLGSMSLTMAQVYKEQQDEDGFLYMTYASQEMFGH